MKNPNRKADVRRAEAGISNRADTLIVVASHSGSALQYAKWISEILETDMIPATKKYLGYTSLYKNIIYIGCVKEGRIETLSLLQQNYSNFNLDGKHIITVAVGVAEPTDSYLQRLIKNNSLAEWGESFFYLSGKVDSGKRKAINIAQMDHCIKHLPELYEKSDAETIALRLAEGYDGMDRNQIEPILGEIRAVRNNTYHDDNSESNE